jgi:hypothetical protein
VAEADVEDSNGVRASQQEAKQNARDARQRARIRELEDEVERYRQASEDALQQLDWCIGYMHGSRKVGLARALASNRSYIRTHLMKRAEQPVPSQEIDDTDEG